MTVLTSVLILFGCVLGLLALGFPVAFSMGGAAAIGALIFMGPESLGSIAVNVFGGMRNFLLVAIPLFLFMANMLERSGVADALYAALHQWLGSLRGGLSMATVLFCTLIAAMSGVSATGIVTMGTIALPIMLKIGYDKSIALGPIMAGGALGVLIPPSCTFIVFGMLARLSIGRLFAGGLIPGLLLAFLYTSYIGIRCYFQPHLAPIVTGEQKVSLRGKIILSKGLILPCLLIVGVLGSIFAGIASPTESAAIGASGAVVCAAINRRLSWQGVKEALYRTIMTSTLIMWVVYGAFCFNAIFIGTGGAQLVKDFMLGLDVQPIQVILIMMLSYFIMGCFLDEFAMMMLTMPIYLPVLISLGFDPIWFGVLFLINMQTAYLTPPYGVALFWMKGVTPPEISMGDLYRSILPLLPLQVVVLLLTIFIPQIALWLPDFVFGLK